ncbi:hypothetical protein [Micromonospora sp. NPDC051141]|uniref:hypothetical protein n=1 Tax=Micromonospora sp. NPDC051141 TaxID=3364284 RepID=UPI0037B241F9
MRSPRERPAGARLARLLTEVFAPGVLVTTLPLVAAARVSRSPAQFLLWGGTALLCCAIIPVGVIVHGVRRGRLTDRHVGDHRQRARPLSIGLASVAVGLLPLAAAVGWSRVRLRDHTGPQVLAGAALGAPLAAATFLALT